MSTADIRDSYDIAIIGAGPAGMAAAATSAQAGLATVLFDEQVSPGGHIYRSITDTPLANPAVLGEDFAKGALLAKSFLASGAQYVPGAKVQSLTPEREIDVSVAGDSKRLTARRVIIATGALERPFPFPGETLPGVMTAGAGQILLKSAGRVPEGSTVLAGCGPLLWQLAWQYLKAGKKVDAILDTTPAANRARALPHIVSFLASPYFLKGIGLMFTVRRHVRVIGGVTSLRAVGHEKVAQIAYRRHDGAEETLPVDTLLVHQGVVPNVNLAMSVGVEHRWDDVQLCWSPVLDSYGGTSVEGIAIAGDGGGIAGAQAAAWRGLLAASAAVRAIAPGARLPAEDLARRALRRFARGRRFLDLRYRPAGNFRIPEDAALARRGEVITARSETQTP